MGHFMYFNMNHNEFTYIATESLVAKFIMLVNSEFIYSPDFFDLVLFDELTWLTGFY